MHLQGMLRHQSGWTRAEGPRHEIVLSSRVRLARNLDGASFPSHAASPALKRVLDEVFAAARHSALKDAATLKLSDLDRLDRRFLVERRLASPELAAKFQQRGVAVDARECLSVMVNEEDHLRLSALRPGLSLSEAYGEADALDDALAARLPFAYREGFGYLTACPTNLGTGLRASCLVHLPGLGLAGQIDETLAALARAGLIVRGLYGEGTKVMGDLFQVSNATGLGRTEAEMLAAIERSVSALADRELRARAALAAGPNRARLEDMTHRAAGLLASARLLSFEEACHHLSALRVGLTLGWKVPGDLQAVSELMMLVQPAHLEMLTQKELPPQELAAVRASLVRKRLGGNG